MMPGQSLPLRLNVMLFQGVQNLPLYAAQQKGFFAGRGLEVDLPVAPNSEELRNGLAEGRYQIVHTSVDNAVAMTEQSKVDTVVFIGGDNGFNHLFVQPDVESLAELRGKTVVVDAPDTAFALILYKVLKNHGLNRGDYTVKSLGATRFRLEGMQKDNSYKAAMLNLPFAIHAQRAGLKEMGVAVDMIGPYQSTTGFALRSWASENDGVLARYTQAYVEGLRWTLDPSNRAEAIGMLAAGLNLPQDIATRCYEIATDPLGGFAIDAKLDMPGFRNVLALRAEIEGQWGGNPPPPERYIDLSYYERAMQGL